MPDIAFDDFCRLVFTHTGLELSAYKRNQMERRLRNYMVRQGAGSLWEFWDQLADPTCLQRFLDYVTINVTGFFRNPEQFALLRDHLLPELARMPHDLAIWSAGCANGAEAYSIQMQLRYGFPHLHSHILATDIDRQSLRHAQQGLYSSEEVKGIPDAFLERYFHRSDQQFQVGDLLQQGIDFLSHDLLRAPYPTPFDLIICRNVVIYFTHEAKRRIFQKFYDALQPGGYLLIGNTERIIDVAAFGFLSPYPHVYQKPCE